MSYKDHLGRQRQEKLKGVHSLTEAKRRRDLKVAEVEKNKVLGYVPPTKDTLAEFVPQYLKYQEAQLTPKAYERTRGIVDSHLKPFFGTTPLAGIRKGDIQKYMTARLGEVSVETARKEFFVLRHILEHAKENDLIPANHAVGVKLPPPPAGRVRYLQPAELQAVLEVCPEWLRPIAALLVLTGMRRGEVLNLRWMDVDTQNGILRLVKTKNGKGHVVRLNALASSLLSRLKRGTPSELVFPHVTPIQVSIAFLRARRKAGIEDFRLHDLRHTAASWLRMSGADLQDVGEVLGHSDLRMTKRYAHLSPAHMEATVRRLDVAFAEVKFLTAVAGD